MNHKAFFGAILLAIGGPFAATARADCPPLHSLNSIKLESVAGGNRLLVPVTINGVPEKLILDTGGGVTQLAPSLVQTLDLRTAQSLMVMFDAYGHGSDLEATVQSFVVGAAPAKAVIARVSATPEFDHGAVGLLSTDLFAHYDVELDFAAGRLNYFSRDHCDGQVAYWPQRPVAAVKITLKGGHITVPVTIDGHRVMAVIDTGAQQTIMSTKLAEQLFALEPGSPGMPQTGVLNVNPPINFYSHQFSELSIAGLAVENPEVAIMTDNMGEGRRIWRSVIRGVIADPYNRVRMDRLMIGMDILKRFHLYIAYGERRLYISPAGGGEPVLDKTAATGN